MVERALRSLNFDTGIEQIIREQGESDARLPQSSSIFPSVEQTRPQLDQVLKRESLDDLVDSFLRPKVHHLEVLLPERYAALLDETQKELKAIAKRDRQLGAELRDAAELLAEEQELRALLHAYRNTLLQA
jgi:hypothetical protein